MPQDFLGTDETPVITPNSDEKTLALLSHVLTFVFPIFAPLIIYLVKKDESPFIAYHAKRITQLPDIFSDYMLCTCYNHRWHFTYLVCGYIGIYTGNNCNHPGQRRQIIQVPVQHKTY